MRRLVVALAVGLSLGGPVSVTFARTPVRPDAVNEAGRLSAVISQSIVVAEAGATSNRMTPALRIALIRSAIEGAVARSGDDPKTVLTSLNLVGSSPLSAPAHAALKAVVNVVVALLGDSLQPTATTGGALGSALGAPPALGGGGGVTDYRS